VASGEASDAVVLVSDAPAVPTALVLHHEPDVTSGLLGVWLRCVGFVAVDVMASAGEPLPDPAAFDLVMALGSAQSAADDRLGWVTEEAALLRTAHRSGTPVLGVCFGGQLLARALGGEVLQATCVDMGWRTVETVDARVVDPEPWFEWHVDTLVPPPEAQVLARTEVGVEAFALDRSLHPEVDEATIRRWTRAHASDLEAAGVAGASLQPRQGIGRDLVDRTFRLLDAFAARTDLPVQARDANSRLQVAG
jgi:GMP synthase-like glutamine amidotransferase